MFSKIISFNLKGRISGASFALWLFIFLLANTHSKKSNNNTNRKKNTKIITSLISTRYNQFSIFITELPSLNVAFNLSESFYFHLTRKKKRQSDA